MLCRRSASLMTSTLQSLAIAMSILRIVAACCASLESKRSRSNFVTPSDDRRHRRTEFPFDLGQSHAGVLDRVVKQGRGGTDCVQPEIGDDGGQRRLDG